jgi:hypothetical protein
LGASDPGSNPGGLISKKRFVKPFAKIKMSNEALV